MAVPELTERPLQELSEVQVQFLTGPASRHPHLDILVIRYAGAYGFGSAGNGDALVMYAMAKAAVAAFEPWGVIHDLSELAYEWGDRLDQVLGVGPEVGSEAALADALFGSRAATVAALPAIVVGPRSAEAVRTLLLGERSEDPLEAVGNAFRDLSAAWEFVDAQIA